MRMRNPLFLSRLQWMFCFLRNCTWSSDLYIQKIRLSEKKKQNCRGAEVTEIVQQTLEATNTSCKYIVDLSELLVFYTEIN